jgi:hypothetical protein
MTNYKAGQREVMRWLTDYGIRLKKVEDLGMQRDESGWEHFAWRLTVENWRGGSGTGRAREECGASYEFPCMQGTAHTAKPTLVDIMSALLSDAGCVIGNDFDGFCSDLGYDPDSRKAKELYDQIVENNAKVCKLFGTTDLDGLIGKYEPLREAAGL